MEKLKRALVVVGAGLAGVAVGVMAGYVFVNRYSVRKVEAETYGKSRLVVRDNYGHQKTAPVSRLEPKVSDRYLQNAPNLVQKAGKNE